MLVDSTRCHEHKGRYWVADNSYTENEKTGSVVTVSEGRFGGCAIAQGVLKYEAHHGLLLGGISKN
jgi:hypothetical protein